MSEWAEWISQQPHNPFPKPDCDGPQYRHALRKATEYAWFFAEEYWLKCVFKTPTQHRVKKDQSQ